MVAAQATASPVLIVGDISARLELELASAGLPCATVSNANDAVAAMKTTRFPYVIVPPMLMDMGGVDFIHGVLRHFDASVVLYGNGVETSEINALLRTGRVAHFPAHAEGHVVADFLARRAGTPPPQRGAGPPPAAPTEAPPPTMTPGAFARAAGPMPTPMPSSSAPLFNLTPGAPASGAAAGFPVPSSTQPGLSAALFSGLPTSTQPSHPASTSFPPQASPGFASTPSGGFAAFPSGQQAPRLPSAGQGGPDPRVERLADELARANADLMSARNTISALDMEKQALLVEVEAARRGAMAQVAEVMALSDEGEPIQVEIDDLKAQLHDAAAERASLRAERDGLVADVAQKSGELAEARARFDAGGAEVEAVRLERNSAMKELESVRAERDMARKDAAGTSTEVDALRTIADEAQRGLEQARSERALVQMAVDELRATLGQEQISRAEIENQLAGERHTASELLLRVEILETQRAELVNALDAAQGAPANTDVENALRIESEKLRADVAAARTDATTVRLDLQEALMRLDETSSAHDVVTKERDALRAEAGPLREWANKLVSEHARQQGELERLRSLVEAGQARAQALEELEGQLQREREKGPLGADVEVLLQRSRKLADLVRALEPFMWGLSQATQFYAKTNAPGAEAHVKLLQQLQGVLLRLRDEIAMLDLG